MLTKIPVEEYRLTLEDCAEQVLWEAGISGPPVNAFDVAERLGIVVARDEVMNHRARIAQQSPGSPSATPVGRFSQRPRPTIYLATEDRSERRHWAVAHEIGESIAYRVFLQLGISTSDIEPAAREMMANQLAGCLLLPTSWFDADGRECDWDLFTLKQIYETASHELIARRMLQMAPPVVITLCDFEQVAWRRSNLPGSPLPMYADEDHNWRRAHRTGFPADSYLDPVVTGLERTRCWPVHEPGWKREIVRSEVAEW